MSQHNSHLTTEQISAFLDQQLSEQEQSTSQEHLNTCELCQQQLADLQQTVKLLLALPQAPLPRSFVLPMESTIQGKAAATEDVTPKQAHNRIIVLPSKVRTAMRIASTLVAVLGLFFILSGLQVMISETSHQSTSFEISTKGRVANVSSDTHQQQPPTGNIGASSSQAPSQLFTKSAAPPPNISQTPFSLEKSKQPPKPDVSQNSSQLQPLSSSTTFFFDTPEAQLSIGLLLLIAGIASVILFTRRGKPAQQGQSQQ